MTRLDDGLLAALTDRGVSRRAFLKFCAAMTATLALPATYAPRIAAAVVAAPRLPVIWLRGQTCSGNTAAFLRASDPTTADLLIDLLSVEYHETLMAAAGPAAARSLTDTLETYPNGYLAVVEGGIPTAEDGIHCLVGGRPFREIVREVCAGASATIGVGSCAFDGGTPAAAGGVTGAVGVGGVASGGQLISLPGCPLNVDNLAATIVHYLTFKRLPPADMRGRPLFAYGGLIHNQCERRAAFEFGQFATSWGDEGAQKGWCLYKMGCKGPEVYANCPTQKYAEGTSWAVRAGHGCIGCTMPDFWDSMGPAYARLPGPVPFFPNITVDQVGAALVGGIAAVTVVHGSATVVRSRRGGSAAHHGGGQPVVEPLLEAPGVPAPEPVADQPPAPPAPEPVADQPPAPPSVGLGGPA